MISGYSFAMVALFFLLPLVICPVAAAEESVCTFTFNQIDPAPDYQRVARIGDVDKDGAPDFAVVVRTTEAKVQLRSGRDCALIRSISFESITDVDAAGDVDRDNVPDVVCAGSQVSKIFSGKDGSTLFALMEGYSAAGIGDVNRDGHPDVIIGNQLYGRFVGRAVVYSGADGGVLYDARGHADYAYFGQSVGGAGDVNKDSVPDFLVGSPLQPGDNGDGRVVVYSGADGSLLHTALGENLGQDGVGTAGDVDGDGYADILVRRGRGWSTDLISGSSGQAVATYAPDEWPYNYCNENSIDSIGDFDGDGKDDYIVNGVVYSFLSGALTSFQRPNVDDHWYTSIGLGDTTGDDVPEYVIGDCSRSSCQYFVIRGDRCLADPAKTHPGQCGCGNEDVDADNDGVASCADECDGDPNKTRPLICGCGISDADSDLDGTADCNDQCPKDATKVVDADDDDDGTPNCEDGCPTDPLKIVPQACGCGVPETGDSDGDGAHDCNELCPYDKSKIEPLVCGCGIPDIDSDGDTVLNCKELCPYDPLKIEPGHCGCGQQETGDSDNDGTHDCKDRCPSNPTKVESGICGCPVDDIDTDNDGKMDCQDGCIYDPQKIEGGICGCGRPDTDIDRDSATDCYDNCPGIYNLGQLDSDFDGYGDACDACPVDRSKTEPRQCGCGKSDADSDGDGVANCLDGCLSDRNKVDPGVCGCGVADTNTDGDSKVDCEEECDSDPEKLAPGVCGCGVSDKDTDQDGTPNCNDACPGDANKQAPGICGCGVSDIDADGDTVPDCNDLCPKDKAKLQPGVCGCGVADSDSDGDGTSDCIDGCPEHPLKTKAGVCGCGKADTDRNQNGIVDCLVNDELKFELDAVGANVRQIKKPRTKQQRVYQNQITAFLRQGMVTLGVIVKESAAAISTTQAVDLAKMLKGVTRKVKRALKRADPKLSANRKKAIKAVAALRGVLV